jgi:hypothetical protein
MTLDEYKQMVEAQRLSSLGIGLEALLKSKAIQEKMSVPSDTVKELKKGDN